MTSQLAHKARKPHPRQRICGQPAPSPGPKALALQRRRRQHMPLSKATSTPTDSTVLELRLPQPATILRLQRNQSGILIEHTQHAPTGVVLVMSLCIDDWTAFEWWSDQVCAAQAQGASVPCRLHLWRFAQEVFHA